MHRAVFLDRDGVLNRAVIRHGRPFPPISVEQVELYGDAAGACRSLREAGFLLIMVSNQPDVARGTQPRRTVEAINLRVRDAITLDDIRVCYHDDADACSCRKPAPGLLLEAAADWQIDLRKSFMIGDRWRDIQAGRRAGCLTVLIDHGYAESQACEPDVRTRSLGQAVVWILGQAAHRGDDS
jgi:D-glycero-D-manno-heptose 1,7-bisphosphate phosphatase